MLGFSAIDPYGKGYQQLGGAGGITPGWYAKLRVENEYLCTE